MLLNSLKLARTSGRVARYHTARLIHNETVAEHSFNVVNLLLLMTDMRASRNLILAGLMHDMGEYATGDIPSPSKLKLSPEYQQALVDTETRALYAIHRNADMEGALTQDEELLLSIADKLDGLCKCLEEYRMGNRDIRIIGDRYVSYLYELMENYYCELAVKVIYEWQREIISEHGAGGREPL